MGREPAADPPSFAPARSRIPALLQELREEAEKLQVQPEPAIDAAEQRRREARQRREKVSA